MISGWQWWKRTLTGSDPKAIAWVLVFVLGLAFAGLEREALARVDNHSASCLYILRLYIYEGLRSRCFLAGKLMGRGEMSGARFGCANEEPGGHYPCGPTRRIVFHSLLHG